MAGDSENRERILEMATEKFFTQGYARVTMDELAHELGMSKKTLYKFFPAKVDLLKAMVLIFIQEMVAEQDRILNDETLDFESRLGELMKLLARFLARINPSLMRELQRAAPGVWKIIEETRQQRINIIFRGLLSEGQHKGYIRQDLNLPLVGYFFAATIRETLNPAVITQYALSLVDAFETLKSVFMVGLLTELGREKFLHAARVSGPSAITWRPGTE